MSFEWNKVTIGEVVESVIDNRGKTPPLTESGYELIEINAIVGKNRYPNYEKVSKFVSEDTYRTWFRKGHPQKDDLLISTVGSIGEVCLMERDRGCIAQNVIALRFHKKIANSMFFYYFFSWEETKTRLKTLDIGSVQPSLKVPHLLSTNLLMPPIEEQANIAAILSSLDDKLELNNAINKNLEEMAQALFKRWFVDFEFPNENGEPYKSNGGEFEESELGLIPKGWKVGRATDIFDVQSGGTPKTSTSEYWNGEIPFFTPKDCSNSLYVIETEKTITEDGLNNCNSKLYKTDTVFITARGTVGKVALAGRDMAMNQSCYALVAKSGYTQKYVFHLTQQLVNVLRKNASGAVFDAITVSTFQNLKTTLPDIELVRHFDGLVNGLYSLLLEKANETQTLQQLRDTLLPKLMSGEIRVPVERDNSATELPMVAESSAIYQP
ncbi:restriction endonuclease subunit S [Paenibacillus barengoltzii]|uniref:Type I restriction enzyme, S subunit n=1 Tax=Paenibacillus barengoltzii J12 TaxID=935846 RepID=A0ABY1LZP1_9BACL|nr:restriction endonuclease subunit S [Paenibacillus barengoltzii]SMF41843.1 type I restriction enzyme, S subunit [Paenibacillus barengoltzii J12]